MLADETATAGAGTIGTATSGVAASGDGDGAIEPGATKAEAPRKAEVAAAGSAGRAPVASPLGGVRGVFFGLTSAMGSALGVTTGATGGRDTAAAGSGVTIESMGNEAAASTTSLASSPGVPEAPAGVGSRPGVFEVERRVAGRGAAGALLR